MKICASGDGMSILKMVRSFLHPQRSIKTPQQSVQLLLVHNLDLTDAEVNNLKSHLVVEIEDFLCERVANRDIQKIQLLQKRRA